jgi:DNA-binding NarL/FixJ family response regulator
VDEVTERQIIEVFWGAERRAQDADLARMREERQELMKPAPPEPARRPSPAQGFMPGLLTAAEQQTAECLGQGMRDQDIAEYLQVTLSTVRRNLHSCCCAHGIPNTNRVLLAFMVRDYLARQRGRR